MSNFATEVARRRIAQLPTEAAYEARRDDLFAALSGSGLTPVGLAEYRLICEALDDLDAAREQEARDEAFAESAWLRAAEYDARMDDPREW